MNEIESEIQELQKKSQ